MSAYSERIKSFEKIRSYMREFYVYGFKSREDYDKKSARSYDDERRRLESWLGDHMSFVRTPEGKNVFISIDSREIRHNPLYKAWRSKSFTDLDITLHFILFDILFDPSVKKTVNDLLEEIDEKYLSGFENPLMFDESTVRKKLKEYCETGIIEAEKEGRKTYYHRAAHTDVSALIDALHYFSEVAPCGVIGSFILDAEKADTDAFTFKHHYITSAIDSGVLAALFAAMQEKRAVSVSNLSRHRGEPKQCHVVPLRIFISAQTGRQHLLAFCPDQKRFRAFRVDYLSDVKPGDPAPRFDELRASLDRIQKKTWGVSIRQNAFDTESLEHVEFTVRVEDDEDYIVRRLEREKRVGVVERLEANTYRFSADVYDASEMIPWIRSFICRIVQLHFSNEVLGRQFKADLAAMYRAYGITEEEKS